jgi:ankyrin
MRGSYSILQTIAKAGDNIDTANKTGNTPLLLAVKHGFSKTTEFLLRNNADVKHANLLGETAIDIANNENHKQIISLLKSYAESSGVFDRLL